MWLGIDVGGTNLKSAVIDADCGIVHQSTVKTEAWRGFDEVFNTICKTINFYLSRFPDTTSIGIGIPGVVTDDGVVIVAPNLTGWNDRRVLDHLRAKYSLPVFIDNDANVAAYAELKEGNGKELRDFIYVSLGTGVGGTIVSDGKIFRGARSGAGEIGHLIISCRDTAGSGSFRSGTLEEFLGKDAILSLAREKIALYPASALRNLERMNVEHISIAAVHGDQAANECMAECGYYLGIGLASAMNLLDIPNVIMGGGISLVAGKMFESAVETIKARSLPSISSRFNFKKAKFSKNAGVIGAALLGRYSS